MQFYGYPAISPSKTIRFLGFAHRFLAAKDLNLLSAVKVKVKVPIVFPSLSADNWSSRWSVLLPACYVPSPWRRAWGKKS